jgi:sporulation protein YlmC with PRC-barrel domain
MEIPLNATVECTDGVFGRSEYVLINPVIDQVTHLVVKEISSPNTEYLVPVDSVTETKADSIRLRCSKAELEKMEPFIKTTFIEDSMPARNFQNAGVAKGMGMGTNYYLPYVTFERTFQTPVEHKQIPPGELSVRRGTRIEATDGYVGQVDEFVVDPENGHITHLVMREGHLWGQKDVIIPVSEMGDIHVDTVFLKLDKKHIESLPNFAIQRRWS